MTEFMSKSGKKVVINLAPWPDAKRLKNAIMREAAASGITLDKEAPVAKLISTFMLVDSSEAVDAALQPCLVRCTRGGVKITEQTFDAVDGRQDYYQIITAVIDENCRPLVESLLSVLPSALREMVTAKVQAAKDQDTTSTTKSDSSLSD